MKPLLFVLGCVCFLLVSRPVAAQSVPDLLQAAEEATANGKQIEALRNYLQALQYAEKDSLHAQARQIKRQIGEVYQRENLHQKALSYFLPLLKERPDHQPLLEDVAASAFAVADYALAREKYENALRIAEQNDAVKDRFRLLQALTEVAHEAEAYETALDYERQILELSRQQKDSASVAVALNNIGYDLKYLEKYSEAEAAFAQALRLQQENGFSPTENAIVRLNLGIIRQNQGDYEAALQSLQRAVSTLEAEGDKTTLAKAYELLASVYFNAGDFYNARTYSDEAEALARTEKLYPTLVDTYELSSLIFQSQEDYQQALEAYKKYLSLRDSLDFAERLRQQALLQEQQLLERSEERIKLLLADQEVRDLEAKRQQLALEKQQSELEVLRQNEALREAELQRQELEKKQARQQLLLTRRQLEAERQERALQQLRQREKVREAELEAERAQKARQQQELELLEEQKKSLEQQQEIQQLEIKNAEARQQIFIGAGVLGLIILLLIAYFLILTRRKNQQLDQQKSEIEVRNQESIAYARHLAQLNEEMQSQKDALAEANENLNIAYTQITDSVRYAQRIQQAIMVEPETALQYFRDGFILFKPRDIVSGDFYWFSDEDPDRILITAVDCTGHGVPGAFMSLIGNDLLNGLVNIMHKTEPATILDELSDAVRLTLQQEKTANRDGMDMALCVYDKARHTLEFAGAKNPLVYIQNGELHRIKGDRMPIGGKKLGTDRYQTHRIPLAEPGQNYFYIFSDGFQDQFGGEKGRKFMSKRFRKLLFDIHQLPMAEQRNRLETALTDWQGKEDQVDDVLVIGFRV